MIVLDDRHLMMIEPTLPASPEPIIDGVTLLATAVLRSAVESPIAHTGWHQCRCGATSSNVDLYVSSQLPQYLLPEFIARIGYGSPDPVPGLLKTNSLLVYYVAFHRNDVPDLEFIKLFAFHPPISRIPPSAAELGQK